MNEATPQDQNPPSGPRGDVPPRPQPPLRAVDAGAAGLGIGALGGQQATAADARAAGAREPAGVAGTSRRAATIIGVPFERRSTVRVDIVGLGQRGGSMIDLFLALPGVRVVALCDVVRAKAERAARKVTAAGQPAPALYTKDDQDFERLRQRSDLDFVYVATPWDSHFAMARAAMLHGKHVGVECPVAMKLGQLWELVDVSECTRRHCVQFGELRVRQERDAGAAHGTRGPLR